MITLFITKVAFQSSGKEEFFLINRDFFNKLTEYTYGKQNKYGSPLHVIHNNKPQVDFFTYR